MSDINVHIYVYIYIIVIYKNDVVYIIVHILKYIYTRPTPNPHIAPTHNICIAFIYMVQDLK